MNRLLALSLILILASCKEEPKNYVTLSGKIENFDESKTLKIFQGRNFERIINLNEDGTFKDTMNIEPGDYNIQHGKQYGQIYLENNFESSFNVDYDSFAESIVYSGDGSDLNNFTVQSYLMANKYFNQKLIATGTRTDLNNAVNSYQNAYKELKLQYPEVDSTHEASIDKIVERTKNQYANYITSKISVRTQFPKGSPSPEFTDYENYIGGSMSLSDLRGKYLYLDIWATWCGPCKAEIPYLQKIEKQYKDKNLQIVSISLDDGRGYRGDAELAYEGWRRMIKEKNLGGIQLLANNGFKSEFIRDFKINSIPRFILLDPEGNIINASAPRPSNPQLIELFNSLGI